MQDLIRVNGAIIPRIQEVVDGVRMQGVLFVDTVYRFSAHPDDYYLYYVVVFNATRKNYIVWTYNDSLRSLNNGEYDLSYAQAVGKVLSNLGLLRDLSKQFRG